MALQAMEQAFSHNTDPHLEGPGRTHFVLSLSQWRQMARCGQVGESIQCQEFPILEQLSQEPGYGTYPMDNLLPEVWVPTCLISQAF